jgi:DNA-binding NarL/FixJ family response regulator
MTKPIALLIADDHAIMVEGLRLVLTTTFTVIGTVPDGRALVTAAAELKPDVIVVDISMPLLNGIEAARQIHKTDPDVKIVFLSMHRDLVYAAEAFLAGGSAYVLKTSAGAELVTAIRDALQGRPYIGEGLNREALQELIQHELQSRGAARALSPRQRQVLQLVAEGCTTKVIADTLHISPRTVEFHRYRLMKSLGLRTIAELVRYAIERDFVPPDDLPVRIGSRSVCEHGNSRRQRQRQVIA